MAEFVAVTPFGSALTRIQAVRLPVPAHSRVGILGFRPCFLREEFRHPRSHFPDHFFYTPEYLSGGLAERDRPEGDSFEHWGDTLERNSGTARIAQ
jgi:hypothetical protein